MTVSEGFPPADFEFVIARVFEAPREQVWRAFSEPERLSSWWGPEGFTMKTCHIDFRPGGHFHYGLCSPDGLEMWGRFVYREMAEPERMVFIVSFSDAQAGLTRHPWNQSWPLEILNTLTLEESAGQTTLTLRGAPIHATAAERKIFEAGHDGMRRGFGATWNQLAKYLASADLKV
jgi:uncharacterized protein YndB with AHSA1/START domain